MRTWISAFIAFIILLVPFSVEGQTPTALSRLDIAIWPEYDRPEVLVIYHLYLDEETSLPADISLQIPAGAGEPFNVAVRESDSQLYNVAYQRTVDGEWETINFTSTSTEIQFEYYDPGIQISGDHRSYIYTWKGDYAVDSLSIQVQQPINAQNIQISPPLGTGIVGEGDLVYYQALVGAVPAANDFSITIDYDKSDAALSIESLKVESSSPVTAETTGRMNLNEILPWVLGILGILLISVGIWWYWQSGKSEPSIRKKKHYSLPQAAPASETTTEGDAATILYCHECGKKSSPKDNFCRACGARLRKDE